MTPCVSVEVTGMEFFAERRARGLKKTPSTAMAYGTRALASIEPFIAPSAEMTSSTATILTLAPEILFASAVVATG
jgi:hypothetical protein